ncbi:hypothetical protein L9F63_012059, partial [Diploptera punctata]
WTRRCTVRSVMHKYLEKKNEVNFDKIFNQMLAGDEVNVTASLISYYITLTSSAIDFHFRPYSQASKHALSANITNITKDGFIRHGQSHNRSLTTCRSPSRLQF